MPTELRQAVLQLYADADRDVAAAGPVCVASGRCCRFAEYGHVLYLSNLETDVLLAGAPPYDPDTVTPAFCPFQKGNLCTAREPRPLGCRVYYCDLNYQDKCSEISERYVQRLKELADAHGVEWLYAPLHRFLTDPSLARPTPNVPHNES